MRLQSCRDREAPPLQRRVAVALLVHLQRDALGVERAGGIPSSTGRFLLSDGWDYLRFVGFESLGDYQAYWESLGPRIAEYTAVTRQAIVASMPELAVR